MIPPELAGLEHLGLVPVAGGKSPAYTATKSRVLDQRAYDGLKALVAGKPGAAARINLHPGPESAVHDMVIAIAAGGKPFVHKHKTREESYHLIEGRLRLTFYDEALRPCESHELSGAAVARIPAGRWHSTEPLSATVVFHESRPGPFDPSDTVVA